MNVALDGTKLRMNKRGYSKRLSEEATKEAKKLLGKAILRGYAERLPKEAILRGYLERQPKEAIRRGNPKKQPKEATLR